MTREHFCLLPSAFCLLPSAFCLMPLPSNLRLDMGQLRPAFDGLPGLDEDVIDDAVDRCLDLVLHLHGLQDEQPGSLAHTRALFDEHPYDAAGHEREDDDTADHLILVLEAPVCQRVGDLDVYDGRG